MKKLFPFFLWSSRHACSPHHFSVRCGTANASPSVDDRVFKLQWRTSFTAFVLDTPDVKVNNASFAVKNVTLQLHVSLKLLKEKKVVINTHCEIKWSILHLNYIINRWHIKKCTCWWTLEAIFFQYTCIHTHRDLTSEKIRIEKWYLESFLRASQGFV